MGLKLSVYSSKCVFFNSEIQRVPLEKLCLRIKVLTLFFGREIKVSWTWIILRENQISKTNSFFFRVCVSSFFLLALHRSSRSKFKRSVTESSCSEVPTSFLVGRIENLEVSLNPHNQSPLCNIAKVFF